MALVALGGMAFGCTELCKQNLKRDRYGNEDFYVERSKIHRGLMVLDSLAGIALIVLAILAMNNILPLPAGMTPALTYAALAVGTLNLIISLSTACCRGRVIREFPALCCAKKGSHI
jgi:hypothetical protein